MATKKYGVQIRVTEEERATLEGIKKEHRLASVSAALSMVLKENAALKAQAKK